MHAGSGGPAAVGKCAGRQRVYYPVFALNADQNCCAMPESREKTKLFACNFMESLVFYTSFGRKHRHLQKKCKPWFLRVFSSIILKHQKTHFSASVWNSEKFSCSDTSSFFYHTSWQRSGNAIFFATRAPERDKCELLCVPGCLRDGLTPRPERTHSSGPQTHRDGHHKGIAKV